MLRAIVTACFACALATPLVAAASDRTALLNALRPAVRADLPSAQTGTIADMPLYDLDLTVRDDLTAYALSETIEFTNTSGSALADVVLRLFGNSGARVPAIQVESAQCENQSCNVEQPRPSILRLRPATAIAAGAKLTIQLRLRGQLRVLGPEQTDMLTQGIQGLGALISGEENADYGLLSFGDGIASLAHFYAVVAQRSGKSWVSDEQKPFGDLGASGLSFVRATVHVPQDVVVVSSGVASNSSTTGHTRTQHITAALVRDFALLASRELRMRSRSVGDVTVRAYYLPRDADGGNRVLDTAASALNIFERRFGAYPYADLDVVEAALVGGAGGCEFSGLVTVASMLYRPPPSGVLGTAMPGSMLEFTTAHEVAHQFWYGLIGSDARAHPFQDEALAQWSARLYFEDRFDAERGAREADAQIAMNYRVMRMLGTADGPVDQPVDAFASALSYAGLVYGKGAFLYPALRKLLGDDTFFAAVRSYARQYRFQNAPPDALFERMASSQGRAGPVRTLVRHWLNERHGDQDLGNAPDAVSGIDQASLTRLAGSLLGGDAPNPTQPNGITAPAAHAADSDLQQLQRLLGDAQRGANSLNIQQLQSLLHGLLPGSSSDGQLDLDAAQKLLDTLQHSPANGLDAPGEAPDTLRELEGQPNRRGL